MCSQLFQKPIFYKAHVVPDEEGFKENIRHLEHYRLICLFSVKKGRTVAKNIFGFVIKST
jgi:hypothetical protein